MTLQTLSGYSGCPRRPQNRLRRGVLHEMQLWAKRGLFRLLLQPARRRRARQRIRRHPRQKRYGVWDWTKRFDGIYRPCAAKLPADRPCPRRHDRRQLRRLYGKLDCRTPTALRQLPQRSIANFISKCLTTDIGYYHNPCAVQSDPWNSRRSCGTVRREICRQMHHTNPLHPVRTGTTAAGWRMPFKCSPPCGCTAFHPRLPVPRRKPRAFPQRQTKAPRQKAQRSPAGLTGI